MRKSKKAHKQQLQRRELTQFLRDFDLLTMISDQQKILYQKADLHQGLDLIDSKYVRNNQNFPFSLSCNLQQFRIFGPGIYLMFKFLKFATILFGIAAIISVVNLGILTSNQTNMITLQANGLKNALMRTTLISAQEHNIKIIETFNVLILVVICIGFLYWSQRQKVYVLDCLKQKTLASYYTVILKQLPQNYNEIDMKNYLQTKYGPITQIYTVRDFGQDLREYKEMAELVDDYKIQKSLHDIDESDSLRSNKLANMFLYFKNGHFKIKQKIKESNHYQFCFAFIQFQSSENRDKLLNEMDNNLFGCLGNSLQEIQGQNIQQYKYKRNQLKFQECQMEPNGILWENLHISTSQKLIKISTLYCLMLILLFLSFFLISSFSAIQMAVNNTIYTKMSKQQIISLDSQYALLSYCLGLSITDFSESEHICGNFSAKYYKITYLVLLIPISISLLRFILTQLMKLVVTFRRYGYQIRKIQSQSIILFSFYFLITGGIQFIVYLSFGQQSSFLNIFTALIKAFIHQDFTVQKVILTNDFTPIWYLLAATNIIIIGAMSFNLSAIGIIFYCFIREKICLYLAKKQKLQIQMNQWLQGYQIEIEYIYASVLTIFFFTMCYSTCVPILYPFAFFSFFIQYWSYKYIFIRFCAKPLTFNHSISRLCRRIIFAGIIMHCLISPIFLGAPGIAGQRQINLNYFQRLINKWYYILIICFLITYKLFSKPFSKLFKRYLQKFKKDGSNKDIPTQDAINNLPPPPECQKQKKRSLPPQLSSIENQKQHQSYSIHECPYLKKTLLTLYTINNKQRSRKTCLLNRQLFHLYQDCIKTNEQDNEQMRTLFDIIKLVRRDFKHYQKLKNRNGLNPYEPLKKKLYNIYLICKGSKFQTYTINQINYQYDKIDYVCEKIEGRNSNRISHKLDNYNRLFQQENKKDMQENSQKQSNLQVQKQREHLQIEPENQRNIMPQWSQNRLISNQKI